MLSILHYLGKEVARDMMDASILPKPGDIAVAAIADDEPPIQKLKKAHLVLRALYPVNWIN